MRTVAATLEIARQTFLQLLRHRLLWLLGLGLVGMPVLIWVMARGGHLPQRLDAQRIAMMIATVLYLYALLPWVAIFFGVQAAHGDIEDRTFQYLFLRPVPRAALLLGKWLAAWLLVTLVMWAGLAFLVLMIDATQRPWPDGTGPGQLLHCYGIAYALGAAAYSAVAALLAARFRWPMVWGAGYIVGLEYLIAILPPEAGVRSLAVVDALRRLLIDGLEPKGGLLRMLWPSSEWRHDFVGRPEGQLLWTIAICVLLAMLVYRRSEYDSRPRE